MTSIRVTLGETMRWAGTWTAAGVPANLTGYTLVAEVRRSDGVLTEEPIVLGDQGVAPGTYTLDVTGLAVGAYDLRIRYTEPDGDVYRSTTLHLTVAP